MNTAPVPTNPYPQLDALLAKLKAEGIERTREQLLAEPKSWVIGELMLINPVMSYERAEAIYDDIAR